MVQYKHTECRQAREKRKAFVCLCKAERTLGKRERGLLTDGERGKITGWIT